MRMSRRDRNEFTTVVYDTLRAYQDGKLKEGCVGAGHLDIPLTNVMDRIVGWIRERSGQPTTQAAAKP